jgi:hypothetical protein
VGKSLLVVRYASKEIVEEEDLLLTVVDCGKPIFQAADGHEFPILTQKGVAENFCERRLANARRPGLICPPDLTPGRSSVAISSGSVA